LVDALNDPAATLTVFAPDNDAFGVLPAVIRTELLTPGFKRHLQAILLYHVFSGAAVLSTALGATQVSEMFNGETLTVTRTDTAVTVTTTKGQTQTVTRADGEGSNGVLHIIDGVLAPSSIGATVIDLGANYSTLLSLITSAGLEATLAGGPFTLFAPTNTAFEALAADTLALLTSDDGAADLASILTYHVIAGSLTSDWIMDGATAVTGEGGIVSFSVGDTVMVNDATVVEADMLAFNGVTHGIDRVLMPLGTIVDAAVATPSLSTLVTAATTAGLVDALNDPAATLTVFAPDNDAFGALPAVIRTELLTPGFKRHLQAILLYHVFSGAAVL
jgi:transforming growth factor-beta-induced protein